MADDDEPNWSDLERAVSIALDDWPPTATPFRWITEEDTLQRAPESFGRLVAALRSEPKLAVFDNASNPSPMGGPSISFLDLAIWLLNRASINDASHAIDDLRNYLASGEVVCHHVHPLASVELGEDQPFTFRNEVVVAPIGWLPNRTLASKLWNFSRASIPIPPLYTALYKTHTFAAAPVDADLRHAPKRPDLEAWRLELEDVALCLSLATNDSTGGIFGVSTTFVLDDKIPGSENGSVWALEPINEPNGLFVQLIRPTLERADDLLGHLQGLSSGKKKVRISMRHLNLFGSRTSDVERAGHLRTTFETIFLDNEKVELRYRLSLHAALFLSDDFDERSEIMKTVKDIYDICSGAVHSGDIKPSDSKRLSDGASLCRRALLKILERGGYPDWQSVELGKPA